MKPAVGCLLAGLALAACAVRSAPPPPLPSNLRVAARLYDLATADVINAEFIFNGTTYGQVNFALPSGETFRGDYHTVSGAVSGWGSIYSLAWTLGGGLGVARAQTSVTVEPEEFVGSAVASSDRGRVIECEYITTKSPYVTHGHGACKDNKAHTYKLMW